MIVTEKIFNKLANIYKTLILNFFILHNIKKVVCNDIKERFFDRITINKNGSMNVFNHVFTKTTWSKLCFDFTSDYTKCLPNIEHNLFLQQRNGKHKLYDFIFNDI